MSRFKSSLLQISSFKDQCFLIPAYQRPYVWGDTQIKKLLQDFWETFERDPNEIYYMGTIVTSISTMNEEELIDGQQRFTTLWLIALAFERLGISSSMSSFLRAGSKIRLQFEIRDEVQEYLKSLADDSKRRYAFELSADVLKHKPYLMGIAHAGEIIFKILPQYIKNDVNIESSLQKFAEFIAKQVVFIKNIAPEGTDLRKLFTVLNNSGVQLEQADILKSKLLEQIHSDKFLFSKIWESCENMDDYFEQSLKEAFLPVAGLSPNLFSAYNAAHFPHTIQADRPTSVVKKRSLADILANDDQEMNGETSKTPDDRGVVCESIISFPQLLLHTLRIFLHRNGRNDLSKPFHSSNLLECFQIITEPKDEKPDEEKVKEFFLLLWRIRYVFDKYVVKWVEKQGERILGIKPITTDLTRASANDKTQSVMLQSMLYFTGNYNTQIWLSPYLNNLLDGKTDILDLERIDNYLSLSLATEKQATWNYMLGISLSESFNYNKHLDGAWGTGFKHYWFYKLEYVLWKTWKDKEHLQFRNYRITSKNSVEHICSQNDEYGRKLHNADGRPLMHTFGNLALLSVGQNSSYGNQDTGKKMIDHQRKPTYDSLKLARFFQVCGANVSPGNVERHKTEMVSLLDSHYANLLVAAEDDDALELMLEEEEY